MNVVGLIKDGRTFVHLVRAMIVGWVLFGKCVPISIVSKSEGRLVYCLVCLVCFVI